MISRGFDDLVNCTDDDVWPVDHHIVTAIGSYYLLTISREAKQLCVKLTRAGLAESDERFVSERARQVVSCGFHFSITVGLRLDVPIHELRDAREGVRPYVEAIIAFGQLFKTRVKVRTRGRR